jgi:hypothetical protein
VTTTACVPIFDSTRPSIKLFDLLHAGASATAQRLAAMMFRFM